jgi:hypothetical protein
MVEYRDRDAFYAADERRKHSAEADFGSRWRDDTGASWRISWLHDTGEIYAVRLGPGLVDPVAAPSRRPPAFPAARSQSSGASRRTPTPPCPPLTSRPR